MHPGSALAAGCFAVLSVWRMADGDVGWAIFFALLAVVHVGLAFSGAWRRGPVGAPAMDDRVRRGWVRIAVLGLALSCAAVFWFPPLALVLAALGAYAALRARRSGRTSAGGPPPVPRSRMSP
jgi:hypothetical protein